MQLVRIEHTQRSPATLPPRRWLPQLPQLLICAMAITAALPPMSARAQSAAGTAAGTTRIAVANPVKVFSELQQTKDLVEDLKSKSKTIDAERIKRQGDIQDLQQRRDTLKP